MAPVISTALHSLTLVYLYLLHGTLFPWGKIKDIKLNNIFKHNFCCGVLPASLTCFFFILCL